MARRCAGSTRWPGCGATSSASIPGPAARALHARARALPPLDRCARPRRRREPRAPTRDPRPWDATATWPAVLSLLEDHRLVTLLGIGGVGKTRLAAEVAHGYAEATVQRACYVDLTKISDPGLVAELTVSELGVRSGDNANVVQMLEEALQRQALLLVLDNFEHVVEAADLVSRMLRWSADLRVLVTSRARLRVAGERVHEVHPLPSSATGPAPSPTRSRSSTRWRPRSTPTSAGAAPRRRLAICRAVDGLPLAIEIAGGHLRTLSPPLLRERLTSRLGSATGAGRHLPDRQQTIPATIDWSLSCSARRTSACSGCSPCSTARYRSRPSRRCGTTATWSTRSASWSTTAWSGARPATATSRASGCSPSCASTPPGSPTGSGGGTGRPRGVLLLLLDDLYERRWTDATDRWLDDISEMLQEVRAAHAWAARTGDVPLTARITAALGAYWFLEGHHAEGLRWIDEMLAVEDQLEPTSSARIHLAAGFMAFPSEPARRARALGARRPSCSAGWGRPGSSPTGSRSPRRRTSASGQFELSLGRTTRRWRWARRREPGAGRAGAQRARRADPRGRATRWPGGLRGGPADLRHPRRRDVRQRVPVQPQLLAEHRGTTRRRAGSPTGPCGSAGRRAVG